MIEPENKLFISNDGWNFLPSQELQRIEILSELGLLQPETIPIFEEATQTAAHFLGAEISILGFIDQEIHWFKSSVGLSRLGLMNDLAQKRQLLRRDSFCSQVVETSQVVVIKDTTQDPQISQSQLVKKYGIRSYLGVPLFSASGDCLGALSVMERKQRHFTEQDIAFLQILARWCMSEFERNRLLQTRATNNTKEIIPSSSVTQPSLPTQSLPSLPFPEEEVSWKITPPVLEGSSNSTQQLKLALLDQLTHELRTPLTSVLGMTSVLEREIYGPLTSKQREYLEIIQHSGKYLLSLVNEINELGSLNDDSNVLNKSAVNIEMLCQQAIKTLSEAAARREQEINLSIEPGNNRIWFLDKENVKQIVYHLLFSMVEISPTGSIIHVHISFKEENLRIAIWASHSWLGHGITEIDPYLRLDRVSILEISDLIDGEDQDVEKINVENSENSENQEKLPIVDDIAGNYLTYQSANLSRDKLGVLLSCQLAEIHGGEISMEGSIETGYRYIVSLPVEAGK